MSTPRLLVSCRFYFPPGDRRLSHWRVIACDLRGRIHDHWTAPEEDATDFAFDPRRGRLFHTATPRADRPGVTEIWRRDAPGGRPTVLARTAPDDSVQSLRLSPDGRHLLVVCGDHDRCRILDSATGRAVKTVFPGDSEMAWVDRDTLRYETQSYDAAARTTRFHRWTTRLSRPGRTVVAETDASFYPGIDRSGGRFQVENTFPEDDGVAVPEVAHRDGRRTRITGDPAWNRLIRENVISALELGERLPDGRVVIQTSPHRASSQMVGRLDPESATVAFWFRNPGAHRFVPGTSWVVAWPLQVFTDHGDITVEERPLYRMHLDRPGRWERIWPGHHHAMQVMILPPP